MKTISASTLDLLDQYTTAIVSIKVNITGIN